MNFPDYSHFVEFSHTISMISEPLFTPEINNIFQNSTHGKFPRQWVAPQKQSFMDKLGDTLKPKGLLNQESKWL